VWGCEIALPWLLGATVDAAVERREAELIMRFGTLMIGLTAVLYVVHAAYLRVEAALVASATFRLRSFIYTRLIEQPLSFFSKHKGGEIGHRIMGDTEVIEKHAIYLFADVPFAALTILGVMLVMLWAHVGLAIVILIVLSVAAALSHHIGRPLARLEKSVNTLYARMGGRLQEVIAGIRTVKSFGRAQHETEALNRIGESMVAAEVGAGKVASKLEPLLELMDTVGLVVVVWYGAYLIFNGILTPGKLVAFIAYMELISEPLQRAGRYYRQFQQARGTVGRITELIEQMPPTAHHGAASVDGPLTITFENVSFAYPESDRLAVESVSLEARPGKIIAIVGANGAGKSTLMDLLLGFQTPSAGRIMVGGLPLCSWEERKWRATTAVLSQEVFLFHASLAENIRYGNLDASDAEVELAAERAGLTTLIKRLPNGLSTVLGDRGTKLSGGERQRVALARVLVRAPRVLVFDEPTSALDGAAVMDTNRIIREQAVDRVTFVIAHRRASVATADRVVLMDHGRIVAAGRIEEIERESELFCRLFKTAA
jgi:ABC-type multidrug transport system fused ATPase/permease subunit